MLNRAVSSWRQRRHPGGDPTATIGLSKHWRTFGTGARSILCICAESHTDADHRTTTGADAPCALEEGVLLAASKSGAQRSRPEKANTSKEAELAWFEKTVRRLRLHSEPGAARRRQRKKRSVRADRRGEDGQSYDDELHHHMARLRLITPIQTAATGERIQATPSTSRDDVDTDALMGANPREEKHGGAQAAEKPSSVLPGGEGRPENEEESDAAWEALKRRVLDAEEHGASLLDMSGGDDAERALRELRAQLRQGWAEEVIRMQAQEESTRSTKKRRRNAGWWTCENGNLLRCAVTKRLCPHVAFL
ncbi:hypothetical protein EI94DRAFT_1755350, partial [Lactarius quietus]